MIKNISVALAFAVLALPFTAFAQSTTAVGLQSLLSTLLAEAQQLEQQLQQQLAGAAASSTHSYSGSGGSSSCAVPWSNLSFGTSGTAVQSLQQFLVSRGFLNSSQESSFFGTSTQQALGAWQVSNGIVAASSSSGWGSFGPMSRNRMRSQCGSSSSGTTSGSTSTTTAASGGVTLSPTSGTAPLPVTLNFTVSPPCAEAYQLAWGDGDTIGIQGSNNGASSTCPTVASIENVTHTYGNSGTYNLSLTFTEANGASRLPFNQVVTVGGTTTTTTTTSAFNPTLVPLSAITNKTTFYTGLYDCILGRAPGTRNDSTALNAWVNMSSGTLYQAYEDFFGTAEYLEDDTGNQEYLMQLYECVLYRQPASNNDQAGYDYWLTQLDDGSMSRQAVLLSFVNGTEFQTTQGPALQSATGLTYAGQTTATTPTCPTGSTGSFPICILY